MELFKGFPSPHLPHALNREANVNFWKPIADKTKGVKKIYFSPDGVYNQINLNTFFNRETGKYLLDETDIELVASTKDLITNQRISNTQIKNATLFGFPDYNSPRPVRANITASSLYNSIPRAPVIKGDTSQRFFSGESIAELPGTKIEVETIQELFRQKSIYTREYLFDKATEDEIKKVKDPQVLHIATHGFFLSNIPKNDERGTFAGFSNQKIRENPLLRSGLLFAGAKEAFDSNKQISADQEDGILTAYEAMNLNLDKTDLVVMSACETGLGVNSNGEGVYGLQRAFQVAGARAVLMSLWTVSDEATQKLMTLFYQNWLKGKTIREAFRESQLTLRTKFPDPYYWGAFVLVGR